MYPLLITSASGLFGPVTGKMVAGMGANEWLGEGRFLNPARACILARQHAVLVA